MPQHKGKEYQIIQPIGSDPWRWVVHLDEETTMTGKSQMKQAAVRNAIDCIDNALKGEESK